MEIVGKRRLQQLKQSFGGKCVPKLEFRNALAKPLNSYINSICSCPRNITDPIMAVVEPPKSDQVANLWDPAGYSRRPNNANVRRAYTLDRLLSLSDLHG